ncbi:unnamed protein product [Angiostrongylus costaricensis]|uniref:AA_permease domain-containing protein n=1 Tax=Angiostrongylus costaricensis TaxID=334426 RepID=A0A158PFB8_ANGCS|nr:unnamed protein product [Angiostrongylus costaricensis]
MFSVAAAETLVNALRNSGIIIIDGSINDMRIFSAGQQSIHLLPHICVLRKRLSGGVSPIVGSLLHSPGDDVSRAICRAAADYRFYGTVDDYRATDQFHKCPTLSAGRGSLQWKARQRRTPHRSKAKKRDLHDIGFNRPIGFLSAVYKLFARVILNRIGKTLDDVQPSFKISDYNPYDKKAMGFVVYFPAVTCVFISLSMRTNFTKNDTFRGTTSALVLSSLLYIVTASLEARFISISAIVSTHAATLEHGFRSMALLKSLPVTAVVVLSSFYCAYTALITAARTVQDVGRIDGLVPGWNKLGRGYGREDAPRIAFAVITTAAVALSMIGEFNIVASMVTIFFLSTYSLFNYAVFMSTLKFDKPAFRYYNRWLALVCSLLCVHIMLAVSWELTNTAIFTFLKFYIYVKWKQSKSKITKEHIGSSFDTALNRLRDMEREADLDYKPQVLLLTGNPAARPALVDFANNITMGRSLLICGFVIPQSTSSSTAVITKKVYRQMSEWLESRNVEAFAATVANKHQVEGAITLLQSSGIGKMRPNILMIGFKANWEKRGVDEIIGFYEIALNAFENDVGVAIFRNSNIGFDLTERFSTKNSTIGADGDENDIDFNPYVNLHNAELVGQLERFRTRIHKGTIDDGGLTVLLPYLLQLPGTYLEGARLRVFIEGGISDRVSNDQKHMAALLRKIGVKSSDLIVISTFDRSPNKATVDDFEELISAFRGNENGLHGAITNVRLMILQ